MERKAIVTTLLILVLQLTLFIFTLQPASASGPATDNKLVIFYNGNLNAECQALNTGAIDMNDWPLTATWINAWVNNPAITLNAYNALDIFTIDMNNQRWPTGWGGIGPGEEPAPRNIYFDDVTNPGVPNHPRQHAAWHFRRAIAHLANKPKYITSFLSGYGYAIETPVPVPALQKYTDYGETRDWALQNAAAKAERSDNPYADRGFIYEYDPQAAVQELKLGGFEDWDADSDMEWNRNYPGPYRGPKDKEELPKMNFWIRNDDVNRVNAGMDLVKEMASIGLTRVNAKQAGIATCTWEVMNQFNYNLYTGGWTYNCLGALLDPDTDFLYDLYSSGMGQFYKAPNYPGFKNRLYDSVARDIKYPPALDDYVCKPAAWKTQWMWAKYIPVIPLWTSKGVKAYRTGWDGVLNMDGKGTDNRWSKHNMLWVDGPGTSRTGPANTIVEGFLHNIDRLHVIDSQWLWDWKALDEIYDSLITRNPFSLEQDVGILATYWETGTWNYGTQTYARFTIRNDAKFHDGTPITPEDVRFSIIFPRDCGIGNAWLYPHVMDVARVDTRNQDPTLGINDVKVYFNIKSAWALHWAGGMPIINKKLWMAAIGPDTAAGYSGPTNDGSPGTFTNVWAVGYYHPWDQDRYNAATGGPGSDGITDLKQDGHGDWTYEYYVPGQPITFSAFPLAINNAVRKSRGMWLKDGTYINPGIWFQQLISDFKELAFHEIGDANYDKVVDLDDIITIANFMPRSVPPAPYQVDLTGDKYIDIDDLYTAAKHFGKKYG